MCNTAIQHAFYSASPFLYPYVVFAVVTYLVAEVEVAVSERLAVATGMNPEVIHSECSEEHGFVALAQQVVYRIYSFSFQRKEYGVYYLYDIVVFELGQHFHEPSHECRGAAYSQVVASHVDVAVVVFPVVAVGNYGHCVP